MRDIEARKVRVTGLYNAGFLVVKPTTASRVVYRMMRASRLAHEQPRLNQVLTSLKKHKFPINATYLNVYQYMNGMAYFQHKIMPKGVDPCIGKNNSKCSVIVIHNNCMHTKEAKIYRFREHLMWLYDGNDRYYSSKTRKYITYINPKPTSLSKPIQLIKRQVSSLKTALAIGYLLNRVVILPKFYCRYRALPCHLNSLIRIKTFEISFSGRYRESSFLQHPRVPDVVKKSSKYLPLVSYSNHLSSTNKVYTVTSYTISKLYTNLQECLINCGNLENTNFSFSNQTIGTFFHNRARKAFQLSNYGQHRSGNFL